MPRKSSSGDPPRPRDSKPRTKGSKVKSVQRAIERTKPPTISERAAATTRKAQVASRLRNLEIFQDIVTWLRQGMPDLEVARRIHEQGFLEDVPLRTVRQDVIRYRTEVMSPAEVAGGQWSTGVLQAAKQIEKGLDELRGLEGQYKEQCEDIARVTAFEMQFTKLVDRIVAPKEPSSEKAKQEVPTEAAADAPAPAMADVDPMVRALVEAAKMGGDDAPDIPAEVMGMTREDALLYLVFAGDAIRNWRGLLQERNKMRDVARKILESSANIKDAMGLLHAEGPNESGTVIEARVTEMIMRKYPGDKKMQEAALNPERRARALAIVKKALTRNVFHDDRAKAIFDVKPEPDVPNGGQ